jgi:hypothetical protein
MATLGKAITFYLRYPAEMDRLYWQPEIDGAETDLSGLDDAENVQRMASSVGEAASNEVADFLLECGKRIEDYLLRLKSLTLTKQSRLPVVRRKWDWQAKVLVHSDDCRSFYCGVSLYDQERQFVPWLWRRGGRAWEDLAMSRLGSRAHSRSGGGVVSDRGTVALPPVPIPGEGQCNEDIDRDDLVAQVVSRFTAIAVDDFEIIARKTRADDDPPDPDGSDS